MKRILILLSLWFIGSFAVAQQSALSNLRQIELAFQDSILLQDSLLIAPASIVIYQSSGQALSTDQYRYEPPYLYLSNVQLARGDSLIVRYRVLPLAMKEERFHLDSAELNQMENGIINPISYPTELARDLIDFKQLDYNGSFSRGISFGNRQDLVLNSNFNLQLAGDLGDGIEIKAAITDENIPLQPEGNTQQLQEFDRVYVELSKNKNSLKAGDYELASPESYFSRYFRKLQGLTFSNELQLGKDTLFNTASVALARGKFARLNVEAIEGNQGPYKLRGAQGERFIIVLSGTERVWLNGKLLRRGIDQDYVIDYNLGELIFTAQQLIRRESRIIVEYDYVDQTYARSIYTLGTRWHRKKSRLSVNLYSQQDSKNSTGFFSLSDEDRLALSNAGDDLGQSIVSSVRPLENFTPARVAYEQKDSMTACGIESILVFSNNEEAELFTANFTLVGSGNGLYTLSESQLANEPVYTYVGRDPQTCQPLGDYVAALQLIPPQLQQLLTVRHEWDLGENSNWVTELALSTNDENRFSSQDSEDDQGLGFFTAFNRQFPLGYDKNSWKMETGITYEYKARDFRELNPYRNQEFLRDWSLANFSGQGQVEDATEHLIGSKWGLIHPEFGGFNYQFNSFLRDDAYRGFKHNLNVDLDVSGWQLVGNSSVLNANTAGEERRFLRPNLKLARTFKQAKGWTMAVGLDAEQNERRGENTDTLNTDSYAFYNYFFELSSPANKNSILNFTYNNRTDLSPEFSGFEAALNAQELALRSEWSPAKSFRLQTNLTYRNLKLEKEGLTTANNVGENFLGQVNANLSVRKGLLRSSLTYNIGGGQEPRRTFSYVRVRKGEGIYIWLDSLYNNDGIIQPNEMEISPFPDQAEYVRVSTFSDDFIQTNDASINWSVQISPKAVWYSAKQKWKKWLAKFSHQASLRIDRRTQEGANVASWNPFQLNVVDSSLIAVSSGIRNILFFNRGNPKYDIQLGWNDNRRKFLQNTGFESRVSASNFLKLRLRLGDSWTSNLSFDLDRQISDSEVFNNKDFEIVGQSINPDFSWVPSRDFQIKLKYSFEQKENQLEGGGERSTAQEMGTEINWNQSVKTSLRGRFSYINIEFDGIPNSPVGFALLNGLQTGNNLLWNLSLDQQLGKNLRLTLSYEGRKTGLARVVNVGRAQVAAVF